MAKPFLKWVGGKRAMLSHLIACMPTSFINYYEPFLGGGALFLELAERQAFGKAFLSDLNPVLIGTWFEISDYLRFNNLIPKLKNLQRLHNEDHYYQVRDRYNRVPNEADFLYLNKTGFNGLYRTSSTGNYNVPIGKNSKKEIPPVIFDFDNLQKVNEVFGSLPHVFNCQSFLKIQPRAADFVYFDPPYDTLFTDYNAGGFTRDHQFDLALFFKKLSYQGVYCMLSNADTPFIRERYNNFNIKEVTTWQNVSGLAHGRGPRKELIITNY